MSEAEIYEEPLLKQEEQQLGNNEKITKSKYILENESIFSLILMKMDIKLILNYVWKQEIAKI